MLSLTIGPLALPLQPLLLAAGLAVALLLLRRLAPREARERLANQLWWALAIGLLAARLVYLLRHGDAYAASPWAMLDVRDGGWLPVAGIVAGLALLLLRAPRQPALRRPGDDVAGLDVDLRAEFLQAAAARGIGVDGACCGKAIHRVSHCPKAGGAPVGTVARRPAGSGRVQTALHGPRS